MPPEDRLAVRQEHSVLIIAARNRRSPSLAIVPGQRADAGDREPDSARVHQENGAGRRVSENQGEERGWPADICSPISPVANALRQKREGLILATSCVRGIAT